MMTRTSFIFNAPIPAHQFIGRTEQIDQILDQLISARVGSAISGDPRVGKTSLFHYLCRPEIHETYGLSSDKYHFHYVDCHNIAPVSEANFWWYILRGLEQYFVDDRAISRRIQALLSQSTPDIFDLNDLSDRISRTGHLVVLMLDEFESIVKNLDPNSPDLLYHLRALLNRPDRGLILVVSTREPLDQLCANLQFAGSAFYNCFSAIALPPFNEAEVDELLAQYQLDLSAEEQSFLRQTAGPHPYLIQLTGALIVRWRDRLADIKARLIQLEKDQERETESYFVELLNHSSGIEKMLLILLALVQLARNLPPDKAKLAEFPQTTGRYDGALRRLKWRGLVTQQTESALFSPIWGRWILRKCLLDADKEAVTRWQTRLADFVPYDRQQFFITLAQLVIERPSAIEKPELLLAYLSDRGKSSQPSPAPITRSIRLSGPVFVDDPVKREVIKQLYLQNNHLDIAQVHLEREFDGGLSGTQVILAQPIDSRNRELAYEVIKIAPAILLRREQKRYLKYVKGRLPATAVGLENGPVELKTIGCLSYGFAGDRPIGTVRDLENYYAGHTADEVIASLNRLMDPLDARWFGLHEPLLASFADEYGQQLPAHLRLQAEQIVPERITTITSHRLVDVQTILNFPNSIEPGDRIAVTDVQVSQVTPDTIKLHSMGDGAIVWIRASLDTPYLNLRDGDQVSILGIVKSRRDDVFSAAATNILNFTADIRRQPDGTLSFQGLGYPCADPLILYKNILKQQLRGWKTIIHGDLHPGNIMVDDDGRAWLIDFDHVREGHVLFDFVRLEVHLRLFVLGGYRRSQHLDGSISYWSHSFTMMEYIAFEAALLQQTLGQPAANITHPDLLKAADVIMAIREIAQKYLRQQNDWHEYLAGLFLQSLAQLRFYQDKPSLGVLPFTTAAIVGDTITK